MKHSVSDCKRGARHPVKMPTTVSAKRRAARLEVTKTQAANKNTVLPKMLLMQHVTQHSIKLICWVAASSGFMSPGKSPVLPSPSSMPTYENAVLDTVVLNLHHRFGTM